MSNQTMTEPQTKPQTKPQTEPHTEPQTEPQIYYYYLEKYQFPTKNYLLLKYYFFLCNFLVLDHWKKLKLFCLDLSIEILRMVNHFIIKPEDL